MPRRRVERREALPLPFRRFVVRQKLPVGELEAFLQPINAEALNSLHEAGEDLIALQSLNVPNTLHRNLLSTNAIENSFRTTRRKLDRVTRFRAETDQALRWLAFALTEVEKGFRRISGYADMPCLVKALERPRPDESDGSVPYEIAAHKISVGLTVDNQTVPNA